MNTRGSSSGNALLRVTSCLAAAIIVLTAACKKAEGDDGPPRKLATVLVIPRASTTPPPVAVEIPAPPPASGTAEEPAAAVVADEPPPPAPLPIAARMQSKITSDAPVPRTSADVAVPSSALDLKALNRALKSYQSSWKQLPDSLGDLVRSGLLPAIPEAPPGMELVIDRARAEIKLVKPGAEP